MGTGLNTGTGTGMTMIRGKKRATTMTTTICAPPISMCLPMH